ncbi:hypothetical protein GOBAR_AA33844 [Gossypium barbadense]|uniref:Uncharacterized protein n=1 Tax=Gossypium barbadense TaxID=3634 RepID=A0A2P5W6Z7_GOSBA|nr:hypothetical protein GOBAR_AA33844 [Gossypium barbadense]
MYVTRPLSMYKQFPSSLSLPPPEGPNSGILVILDEEAEPTCCFGLCKSHELDDLPFPQNKKIELQYTTGTSGENRHVHCNDVFFIPVLGQPLSSNRYYALQPRGSHEGEAFTNSSKEDAVTCCFCRCFPDIEPQPADEHDIYQQFEIRPTNWGGRFVAKSVAQDGVPPGFLGRKGWRAFTSIPRCFTLGEAPGLDTALRARLPHFDFPLSCKNSEPVVQRWEQLFAYNNDYNEDNVVVVDTTVEKEVVKVNGTMEISVDDQETVDRVMWFRKGGLGIGLSLSIVERMKWEEERFGWSGGKERQERVKRVEKMETNGEWNRFGWYVLVERFALRRMDGSLALTYDFKHTQSVRNKWE